MYLKLFSLLLTTAILLSSSYAAKTVKKQLAAQGFQTAKENNDSNNLNVPSMSSDYEDSTIPDKKPECKPGMCPRLYKPICASVNGIPLTSPTMCHYNDKIRCYRQLLEPGEEMPVFKILHEGACDGREFNILTANKPRRPAAQRRQGQNGAHWQRLTRV